MVQLYHNRNVNKNSLLFKVDYTTLFVIGEDNADLGYQMQKDGSYINPMDMLAISG